MKIIKNIILLIAMCASLLNVAQCQDSIYYVYKVPEKKSDVSEADYKKAIFIIDNTESDIKSKGDINYIHYLNYATASILLNEPISKIESLFDLAYKLNQEGMKGIFPKLFPLKKLSSIYSRESYKNLLMRYEINQAIVEDFQCSNPAVLQIIADNNFSEDDLVNLIKTIQKNDQKHRGENENWEIQNKLDVNNMILVDSLFNKYNTYIGTSLVGEENNHVMWLVIQHTDIMNQEKYLPIIAKAVKEGELPETPLKMLLDRIYTKKFGYQIYGSQFDTPIASNEVIKEVKERFKLY